jgi:hypothetical protein
MRTAKGAVGFLTLVLIGTGACTREQLGLPRVPVSVTSPDGRFVAFVRNHPNVDPPAQSIWLQSTGASAAKLKALGGDSDWCDRIVWSADSSTVSYLVQGARLITVDALTGRVLSEQWLTDWQGEYPPHRRVRDLSLSPTGNEARYRDCDRLDSTDCGPVRTRAIRMVR